MKRSIRSLFWVRFAAFAALILCAASTVLCGAASVGALANGAFLDGGSAWRTATEENILYAYARRDVPLRRPGRPGLDRVHPPHLTKQPPCDPEGSQDGCPFEPQTNLHPHTTRQEGNPRGASPLAGAGRRPAGARGRASTEPMRNTHSLNRPTPPRQRKRTSPKVPPSPKNPHTQSGAATHSKALLTFAN
ncbi:MAG: hypothetical protein IJL69_02945, partial [Oscillospiraceae bacterium]|nr:hypothetical protein [Oscillospiraceae bacterium]